MRVLVLTKGDERVASSRVRVWQLFRRLEERDVSATIIHSLGYAWWSVSAKRFRALKSIMRALREKPNLVFVHKSLFPWDVVLLVVWWCRIKKIPYVYDCDDAEWLHSPRKTNYLMRHAAVVFAGSQHIQQYAEKYSSRVAFIPSAIDRGSYADIAHDALPPVIIWVGHGPAHLRSGNFSMLRDALRLLNTKGVQFQFVLAGGNNDEALRAYWKDETYYVKIIDAVDWKHPDASAEIFRAVRPAIGVMPLADTPFARAKCAYKAIEYMAAGIPVVSSPVGEAISLLERSQAGVLADDVDAWVNAIERLLGSESDRRIMGQAGYREVILNYDYNVITSRVMNILQNITR